MPADDIVTDEDYEEAICAQDTVLYAQGHERKVNGKLRYRLLAGARDAGVKYYFDFERGIVRHRRLEPGSTVRTDGSG